MNPAVKTCGLRLLPSRGRLPGHRMDGLAVLIFRAVRLYFFRDPNR
jgi:hypothetical protein